MIILNTGFVFGWGKPVPFNPANFSNPRRDRALVALAGPMSNLLIALILAIPIKYVHIEPLNYLFQYIFFVSLGLMVFNLIPLPPLDGSKVLGLFVPDRYHYEYEVFLHDGEKYFFYFLVFDMMILPKFLGFSMISLLVGKVMEYADYIISLTT